MAMASRTLAPCFAHATSAFLIGILSTGMLLLPPRDAAQPIAPSPVAFTPSPESPAGELRKIKDVVLYNNPSFHSAFPSLVVRPDGTILCAFRRAPDRRALWGGHISHTDANAYLVSVESTDGGLTWSPEPRVFFAHTLGGSQDPCMIQLRDGAILCASYGWAIVPEPRLKESPSMPKETPFGFLGGYVIRSTDGGKTWSPPIEPPVLPGEAATDALGRPCPTYNRGALLECRDGRLLWAVVRHDAMNSGRTSVHLIESRDGGVAWTYVGPIAVDEKISFNETSLVETAGGDIVAFLRTAGFGGRGAVARSTDRGKTFLPWKDMGFVGEPFQATRLPDDRILLVYGYRTKPCGIRARQLDKEARSVGDAPLADAPEIVLRDDGGSGDLGYPWSVVLPDGKVLVAYYFNKADGTRHIAGTILEWE